MILIHKIGVHRRFQAPWERREGATHTSRLEFCLVFSLIVFQATPAKNLWQRHSKSACSPQLSFRSSPWCLCGHDLYTDNTRASRWQAKGRQSQHWSRVAGSAGPALLPLIQWQQFAVNHTLQKQIGCFNHRVVTLVADKQWLWEFYFGIRD